jgi:hypothetical protein
MFALGILGISSVLIASLRPPVMNQRQYKQIDFSDHTRTIPNATA